MENGLVRTSSKKLFRKWKPARISLYEDRIVATYVESRKPLIIMLNDSMKLSNVFEQKVGSLIEGKKTTVYFCRLVRDVAGGAIGAELSKEDIGPMPFLDQHETETVLKFGSCAVEPLVAFSRGLDSRLTSSTFWEAEGRRRAGSRSEQEGSIRDIGRQYRGSENSQSASRKSLVASIEEYKLTLGSSPYTVVDERKIPHSGFNLSPSSSPDNTDTVWPETLHEQGTDGLLYSDNPHWKNFEVKDPL